LAVLPAGTGNVLAAQLGLVGIPTPLNRADVRQAAEALCAGRIRAVDTGIAMLRGGRRRHFLLWAGIGLDATVAEALEGEGRELKRAFGSMAYGALGLTTALATTGTPAAIRCDDERIRVDRLLLAVVANIPLYAGTVQLTREAWLDDGRFEVSLFGGESVIDAMAHVGALLAGWPSEQSDQRYTTRAGAVRILAAVPMAVHLDAEPFGTTPVSIAVRPASLRLLVPPTAPATLFGRA
jgi:diacylglycerol kinase family enzyme